MTTESKIDNKSKTLDKDTVGKEFAKIIAGLEKSAVKIAETLKQRIGPGEWKLWSTNCKLNGDQEQVDLVFKSPAGRKDKYIIVDVSVPHLQIGQKYQLPSKGRLFQAKYKVTTNRLKKAIILVRKGTETISTRPLRIRCPIIELQYEQLVKEPRQARPSSRRDKAKDQKQPSPDRSQGPTKPSTAKPTVDPDLLFALKEAIVHECLSTMHKRHNKYICKGLWRWIEREIMDPSVHFYLVILSSIYQGKTGDVLSRKFQTWEEYSDSPEDVVSAIFSRENNLADEIKRNSDRHQKALKKFLACFGQTPPFEYLRSLFLKEFRSTADGLKSRMSVYTTLSQLLERCGFEGEKETQYPLEILDELGIFKGIMTGNYARLRTDNASKKLKHLVPDINWTDDEIYQLRNQLAKALNLPSQEFNLNAFLPQAFLHDARHLAESRKEAIRSTSRSRSSQAGRQAQPERPPQERRPQRTRADAQPQTKEQAVRVPQEKTRTPANTQQREVVASRSKARPEPSSRRRSVECDETRHRYFENFGGHEHEDTESVRLALAMVKYEIDQRNKPVAAAIDYEREDRGHVPPIKHNNHHFTANHLPPRKRPQTSSSPGNSRNRNDKRRRYSKSQVRRTKPQRPSSSGDNR